MREIIRAALVNDATLQGLGVAVDGSNVYAGNVDTPTQRPFLQMRWGGADPGVGRGAGAMAKRGLVIWVHDTADQFGGGDYARIDSIIRRIKAIFADFVAEVWSDGAVSVIDWLVDSDDLSDDGHGTITRNTTFAVVGTGN